MVHIIFACFLNYAVGIDILLSKVYLMDRVMADLLTFTLKKFFSLIPVTNEISSNKLKKSD